MGSVNKTQAVDLPPPPHTAQLEAASIPVYSDSSETDEAAKLVGKVLVDAKVIRFTLCTVPNLWFVGTSSFDVVSQSPRLRAVYIWEEGVSEVTRL